MRLARQLTQTLFASCLSGTPGLDMCQRGEPDLWTLGNGETRWSAWEQSQRERRRKTNSYQPPALGNRGSRCGSGIVALEGIHPIWSVRTGPCVLTTCQLNMSRQNAESGVKAHVKATGASSAARICHMHCRLSIRVGGFGLGSPSRALVTFHFRTFQQGSEHRNRGEMPSVSSVGHFPSTAGRYRAGGRGAKKEEAGARSGLSPCTDLARHDDDNCSPRWSAPTAFCFHFRTPVRPVYVV